MRGDCLMEDLSEVYPELDSVPASDEELFGGHDDEIPAPILPASTGYKRPAVLNSPGLNKEELEKLYASINRPIKKGISGFPSNQPAPKPDMLARFNQLETVWHLKDAPINWAVRDLFTEKGRIVLAGEQKAGKSFVVSDLALAFATSAQFLGEFDIEKPGPVLVLMAEDDMGEFVRRLDRNMLGRGMSDEEIAQAKKDVYVADAHGLKLNRIDFRSAVQWYCNEHGVKLVIADPLARLMDGDENSKESVSQILEPAGLLADEYGLTFAFVHHLGKPKDNQISSSANRIRGSSDIASWFTTGIFVNGSLSEGKVELEVIQRVSGNLPPKFDVEAIERPEKTAYERNSIRFQAKIDKKMRSQNRVQASQNELDKLVALLRPYLEAVGAEGATVGELYVRSGIPQTKVRVALDVMAKEALVFAIDDESAVGGKRYAIKFGTPGPSRSAQQMASAMIGAGPKSSAPPDAPKEPSRPSTGLPWVDDLLDDPYPI
jgi:AAA domain